MIGFRFSHVRFALALVLLLASFVLSGCGSSGGGGDRATVDGNVTIDGKPANSGEVTFNGDDGSIGTGFIQANGSYHATDAPVGAVKITVTSVPQDADPAGDPDNPSPKPKGKPVPIPQKYAEVETSKLTTTLKAGENKYDVKLSSK